MSGYMSRGPTNGSVYVCNLPPGTDEAMLAEHFGTIGLLKKDKRTGRPKIWIYRDKVTDEPKGDATVTYEDPHAASAAVEWFNNKDFHGTAIEVHIAESKTKDAFHNSAHLDVAADVGGQDQDELGIGTGRGRGRGDGPGKAWQQDGDWMCPNTSCGNVNFAFRGVCNRCGAARPSGAGGGAGGGGRGRGRGSADARGSSHAGPAAVGGPPGLFGPNDWPCPMCGNINWAKRMKCNVCNTSKPGTNEGGVRGGRGGGYKELDEQELEEVKRRRKEAEDDGEMYDEFGNLKKKFRAKAQRTGSAEPGSGRAEWGIERRGSAEREGRERSRDRGRNYDEREGRERSKDRGRNDYHEREGRERSKDRGRSDYDEREGRERSRDHGRDNHEKERRNIDRGDHGRERRRSRSRERGRDRGKDQDYESRDRDRDRRR